jgi:hypothetical protein
MNGATHGFLLSGGNFSTIDFPGAAFTQAIGINDHGQVVGEYRSPGVDAGFLATPVTGTSEAAPQFLVEPSRRE